jgi:hypothetical protein
MDSEKVEKITAEEAVQTLKSHGLEVTMEEAQAILDFLYLIADISISQLAH